MASGLVLRDEQFVWALGKFFVRGESRPVRAIKGFLDNPKAWEGEKFVVLTQYSEANADSTSCIHFITA